MKSNQLPKLERASKIGFGACQVTVVPVTAENKDHLIEAVFSSYLGEQCKYCEKIYETPDDLKDTVWAGEHEHGRLACRSCWSANNKAGALITYHVIG